MPPAETRTFYDEHPFDWAPPPGSADASAFFSRPLLDMIDRLNPSLSVFDIGCGPGRVLGYLAKKGFRCFGLDRSRVSLGLAAERYGRPGVVADNLRLPLADESADVVISDGVIHHTENPRAAFLENSRVLKPGGWMYLGVYRSSGRYPVLYKFPGGIIRAGLRHKWMSPFITVFFRFPYFLVHFIRSKGKRTWSGARNLFYDYFVTPQVAFLARATVESWCRDAQMQVEMYDENLGQNVHSFCLVKQARRNGLQEHR